MGRESNYGVLAVMQKTIMVNIFRRTIEISILLISFALLAGALVTIAFTFKAIFSAVNIYGLSITKILLDAKFGYLGLLSLGLSSCALILASSSTVEVRIGKFIKLFRVTFFIGLFFLLPTIFASALYLIRIIGL